MKLTHITPHLIQLTRYGLVNCYLVLERDSITLVDTGLPNSGKDILAAARTTGLPIHRILLTHAHMDHIGSLDELAAILGPIDVAISARDARLLRKNTSLDPAEPQTPIKGSLPGAATVPTHFVIDGELYGSLRVLRTPGHTPGHLSFLDERDGTLLAGDALTTVRDIRLPGDGPWTFPFPGLATWHKPTAYASVECLVRLHLPIHRIAAGHGAVRPVTPHLLEQTLTHAAHLRPLDRRLPEKVSA